jgi:NAD-dependent SIR2 family protein deacetylase
MLVSIIIQTKNNKKIKVLFDNDLENKDWEDAIELMIDHVMEHYNNKHSYLSNSIKQFEDQSKDVYAIFDKESDSWTFLDDRGMLMKKN